MYLFKDVKKHLSSKQTERQPDRPRTRPRPQPHTRPRAPSLGPRLRLRLNLRFTKARRLPFLEYQLFVGLFCFYRIAISSNMLFFKELQLFLSGYVFSWHLYGESGIRIRTSRVEIFEYAMNPECVDAKSGHFLIWWRSSVLLLY